MIYAATTREPNIVFCDPVETRTRNPLIKSEVLWPIELRSHFFNIQYVKEHFGGAGRNRTYIVGFSVRCLDQLGNRSGYFLVGIVGLEPTAFSVSARCSNQLSYIPIYVVLPTRIELAFLGWKPNVLTVRRRENFYVFANKEKGTFWEVPFI